MFDKKKKCCILRKPNRTLKKVVYLETIGTEKIKQIAETALNRVIDEDFLDEDDTQKILENSDKFQSDIITIVRKQLRSKRFVDEESKSKYGYSSGYNSPIEIAEQVNILRQLFPHIGFANENISKQPLPSDAEGWFAILRWELFGDTYEEALERIFYLIKERCKGNFYKCHEEPRRMRYLQQNKRTVEKLEFLKNQQLEYDILVIPAQFGILHRGRSVRRVHEIIKGNEFDLGPFEVACMLLTHLNRLANQDDLRINCSGAEYIDSENSFVFYVPTFHFSNNKIILDMIWDGHYYEHYGLATGFLFRVS
jgi:hypothetical protein